MSEHSYAQSELKTFSVKPQYYIVLLALMCGLSSTAKALTHKAAACAAMLSLSGTGEDVLPLIMRLEERVKLAGQIRDDGVTEFRAINFNGSLESMSPKAARSILRRLEGLRDGLRFEDEVRIETPIVFRGEKLRAALADLPGALRREGGENGGLLSFLRFREFDRNLPALVGTLQDMLANDKGEPLRFASADYDALDDETVRADGTIEPARMQHVLVDHIAFRDDLGEPVWVFVVRAYQRQPAGRRPKAPTEAGDFDFLPNFGAEPVLVPVPVRVKK